MASGDAQRVWFAEMRDMLAAEYNSSLSLEDLIMLTARLDEALQKIRREKNISPPMIWCPHCKERRPSAPPRVSVRAVIIALGRFGIASEDEVRNLDARWKKYRKENALDRHGEKPSQAESSRDGDTCHGGRRKLATNDFEA